MTTLDELVATLERRGALRYRALPADERRWRGTYLLLVASLGASAPIAWAAALAATDADRALTDELDEELLLATLSAQEVDLEDFLPYD
jgi:hypothetical protein